MGSECPTGEGEGRARDDLRGRRVAAFRIPPVPLSGKAPPCNPLPMGFYRGAMKTTADASVAQLIVEYSSIEQIALLAVIGIKQIARFAIVIVVPAGLWQWLTLKRSL